MLILFRLQNETLMRQLYKYTHKKIRSTSISALDFDSYAHVTETCIEFEEFLFCFVFLGIGQTGASWHTFCFKIFVFFAFNI